MSEKGHDFFLNEELIGYLRQNMKINVFTNISHDNYVITHYEIMLENNHICSSETRVSNFNGVDNNRLINLETQIMEIKSRLPVAYTEFGGSPIFSSQ